MLQTVQCEQITRCFPHIHVTLLVSTWVVSSTWFINRFTAASPTAILALSNFTWVKLKVAPFTCSNFTRSSYVFLNTPFTLEISLSSVEMSLITIFVAKLLRMELYLVISRTNGAENWGVEVLGILCWSTTIAEFSLPIKLLAREAICLMLNKGWVHWKTVIEWPWQ